VSLGLLTPRELAPRARLTGPSVKRNDLRALATLRLREARLLLDHKHWDGAYYLAGYVVELALKACIAKRTERFDFPDKDHANKSWSHDWHKLLTAAALEKALREEERDGFFSSNWKIVQSWEVDSRYDRHGEREARDLIAAVADRKHGVLRWLKRHW
jgi:HEPN domain-containing protein